ncbi:MAG: hypothetical protein FPO08_00215 [Geobacter sp.]|nr:MAG: hypothetical protein FPO08_00215 [Geobacter sp.]
MNKSFAILMLFLASFLTTTGSAIGADAPEFGSDEWMDRTVLDRAIVVAKGCDTSPSPVICADNIVSEAHMFELLGAKAARHHFAYRIINNAVNAPALNWETKVVKGRTEYSTDSKVMFSVTDDPERPTITGTRFLPRMSKPNGFMNWCVETFWRTTYQAKREQLGRRAYAVGVAQAIAALVVKGQNQDLADLRMVFEKETKEARQQNL